MSVALALTLLLSLVAGSGARPAAGTQPCSRRGWSRRLAQADIATPEVVTANVGHSENISGTSNISPQAWPVPAGFRPAQHWVMRVVGRGVVQKRLQMEAGWRTYVEEVVEMRGAAELATHRHINFTDHPSTRPDLAALESVDEEVVLYAAPGADPRLFTAGNASARAAAEAGLVQRIRARGLDVQLLQLYVGPLLGASSPERATRSTTIAATHSKLLVSGSGLVPPRIGVQTAALLALHSAAAAAELPLLSCNITSWQLASSADARRLNMSASGLVEADVWVQTPGNSFQPSDFWQKVLPRMPEATEAAGVPLRLWFLSAATVYMTENGTEIGRSADVAAEGSIAAVPSPDIAGGGEHVTFKIVAIIAVLSAGVVLVASLIGLTVWLCLRRRRHRRQQRKRLRGRHAADCPLHACTCHRAKAQSASSRTLQGGTHSGPLPPAMLLNADPGHRSPAGSGGTYSSAKQAPGSSCGAGCRVHALLDHSAGCGVQPFGQPKSPGSSGGASGAAQAPSSGGGRPPRAPPYVGSAHAVAPSSSGSCCCAGTAAVSDCHPGDGVAAPATPARGSGGGVSGIGR